MGTNRDFQSLKPLFFLHFSHLLHSPNIYVPNFTMTSSTPVDSQNPQKMTNTLSVFEPPKQPLPAVFPRHSPLASPAQTRIHTRPRAPITGLPGSLLFSCFFLCLCGFPRASGSGSGSPARRRITKKALCRGVSTAQGLVGLLCCFGPQRCLR